MNKNNEYTFEDFKESVKNNDLNTVKEMVEKGVINPSLEDNIAFHISINHNNSEITNYLINNNQVFKRFEELDEIEKNVIYDINDLRKCYLEGEYDDFYYIIDKENSLLSAKDCNILMKEILEQDCVEEYVGSLVKRIDPNIDNNYLLNNVLTNEYNAYLFEYIIEEKSIRDNLFAVYKSIDKADLVHIEGLEEILKIEKLSWNIKNFGDEKEQLNTCKRNKLKR